MKVIYTDVLVIGAGLAGLRMAVHGKFIEIREQSQVICSHVYSPY